jgi:hypothetical protein
VTPEAARRLVRQLASAFPFPQVPDATANLYYEELVKLDEATAAEVIAGIVQTETRWPSLALVLSAYRRRETWKAADFAETHGLPEPGRAPIPAEVVAWMERQRVIADERQAVREARQQRRERLVWQDTTPVDDVGRWAPPSPDPDPEAEDAT